MNLIHSLAQNLECTGLVLRAIVGKVSVKPSCVEDTLHGAVDAQENDDDNLDSASSSQSIKC